MKIRRRHALWITGWAAAAVIGCGGGGGASSSRTSDGPDGGILTVTHDDDAGDDGTGMALEIVGDAAAGQTLFQDVLGACFVCHGDRGEGTVLGPSIVGASVLEVEGALTPGSEHTGGTMPALTGQDFADLAAYLGSDAPATDVNTNGLDSGDVDSNGLAARRPADTTGGERSSA